MAPVTVALCPYRSGVLNTAPLILLWNDGVKRLLSVSVDRDGDITHFANGVVSGTPATNLTVNSIDNVSKNLTIGISSNDEVAAPLEDGAEVGEVFAYKGVVLTAAQWLHIYNRTKGRYL